MAADASAGNVSASPAKSRAQPVSAPLKTGEEAAYSCISKARIRGNSDFGFQRSEIGSLQK